MSKFKVGDIVVGNRDASREYSITTEGVVLRVIDVYESGFRGKIESHPKSVHVGRAFHVSYRDFDLVNFSLENE